MLSLKHESGHNLKLRSGHNIPPSKYLFGRRKNAEPPAFYEALMGILINRTGMSTAIMYSTCIQKASEKETTGEGEGGPVGVPVPLPVHRQGGKSPPGATVGGLAP